MNWRRKILCTAALLAAMPAAVFTAASAEEMDQDSTFTITVNDVPSGHSYTAYRVFSARTAPDGTLSDIQWGDGVHSDAFLEGVNSASFAFRSAFAGVSTAAEAAAVISGNSSDADFVRTVSRLLVQCRASAAADSDTRGNVLALTGGGWYLTLDETALNENNDALSAVLLHTSQSTVTVDPKIDVPEFEKVIISGQDHVKTEDFALNDTVTYLLTAVIPDTYPYYETYELHFFDTSEGVTYVPSSFTVKADGDPVQVSPAISGNSFVLDIADLKSVTDKDMSGKQVTVQYEATLNSTAVMGGSGNTNTAYIKYSNDPYGNGLGKSAADNAAVFTYGFTVHKTDENNQPLSGAAFVLEKKNSDGSYTALPDASVTENGTCFTFDRLNDGEYRLRETETPVGYNSLDPVEFTVSSEHSMNAGTASLTALSYTVSGKQPAAGTTENGQMSMTAVNRRGITLPATGGAGTVSLYGIGGLTLLASVILKLRRHEKG